MRAFKAGKTRAKLGTLWATMDHIGAAMGQHQGNIGAKMGQQWGNLGATLGQHWTTLGQHLTEGPRRDPPKFLVGTRSLRTCFSWPTVAPTRPHCCPNVATMLPQRALTLPQCGPDVAPMRPQRCSMFLNVAPMLRQCCPNVAPMWPECCAPGFHCIDDVGF